LPLTAFSVSGSILHSEPLTCEHLERQ
jgi:hypothetical protein